MLHLPILRGGRPYESLTQVTLKHVVSGEPVATVSRANPGLIARDLESDGAARQARLQQLPVSELLEISAEAARLYVDGELPVGDEGQAPQDYIRQLSATTGLPEALCRMNMEKTRFVLAEMGTVLDGLTRGMDLEVLDSGWSFRDDRCVSYRREADSLGAILPSNSPGVHSLWIPAIGLKVPLVLKPGRQEPWTPYRIAQALMAAGCPPEAFGFYPTDHNGADTILLKSGRCLIFGDESTVASWKNDPRIEIHGPGWSKVLVGADRAAERDAIVELTAESVAANGGRSCVNASGLWLAEGGDGRRTAEALAERLAAIEARTLDDPQARLAAFSEPRVAHLISKQIDSQLARGGAEDLTAALRPGGRVAELDGLTFLLPTVIWCEEPDHPLAQAEYLFPFVSVVERPQERILEEMGPSLVVSALTGDQAWIAELLSSPRVERLNLGAISTSTVVWDQPHEGNLFELLYHRRAFQGLDLAAAGRAAGTAGGASEPPDARL